MRQQRAVSFYTIFMGPLIINQDLEHTYTLNKEKNFNLKIILKKSHNKLLPIGLLIPFIQLMSNLVHDILFANTQRL